MSTACVLMVHYSAVQRAKIETVGGFFYIHGTRMHAQPLDVVCSSVPMGGTNRWEAPGATPDTFFLAAPGRSRPAEQLGGV